MKSIIFFASTLLLAFSQSMAMSDLELQNAIRAEVEPQLITMKRPRVFFHWTDASDITPQGQLDKIFPANSQNFINYVENQGKKIIRATSPLNKDIAGPGLYLASDPVSSRSYGGKKSFGLIVGKINLKARILPETRHPFSKNVIDEIDKRGCKNTQDIISLLNTYNSSCTKIKELVMGKDASFIDGRLYTWDTFLSSITTMLPGCKNYSRSDEVSTLIGNTTSAEYDNFNTIVAYNKNLFSEIVGFTPSSNLSNNSLFSNSILSYLKLLDLTVFKSNLLSKTQKDDSSIIQMSASEAENFTQKNIYGCH